jgi:hypothetical protein
MLLKRLMCINKIALEPPTIGLAYQPSIISRERIETLLLQQLRSMKIVVTGLPE